MKKILLIDQAEYTIADLKDCFDRLGYNYTVFSKRITQYDNDEKTIELVKKLVRTEKADCIFSFNYYPDMSRVADAEGILYISWCFDSPLLTLESVTVPNRCNRIFTFDEELAMRYRAEGYSNVFYMPLACNIIRLDRQLNGRVIEKYDHEITFLGSLYDDQYDFFNQIGYLPDYLKGYLEATIETHMKVYGFDITSQVLTPEICEELSKYVKIGMGPNYRECRDKVYASMLQKQVTVRERRRVLTVLGEYFNLDIYSYKEPEGIKARFLGKAEYLLQMPEIFNTSKINLNLTLRTIQSGLPLRILDIMGAGGFCITNYQAELEHYFENGVDLVWFDSHEDLFAKVKYYLEHDEERRQIAENGRKKIREQFSYEQIVSRIFSIVNGESLVNY